MVTSPREPAAPEPRDDVLALVGRDLRVVVSRQGAELVSVQRASSPTEILWQGDPVFWSRRAPLLFPIVGALRGGVVTYRGTSFTLPQHGFARDRRFEVVTRAAEAVTLRLEDDETTRAVYPFRFRLDVTYRLHGDVLRVGLGVTNPGRDELLFSIGGHPGFRCPLRVGERMEDYVVELEREETAHRWPVIGGLIGETSEPFVVSGREIELRAGLFDRGALVFKGLASRWVRLVHRGGGHGVVLGFAGFPYLGIWSKPGAPFVCLEPWCGIADSVDASGRLEDKEGIVRLAPAAIWERGFDLRVL